MKFIFVYIIIYLSHIECINSENKRTSSQFISNFISPQYYKKIIDKYDTNLQIIENKTLIREILINTSYLSNVYNFEFLYSGKLLYINETNLNLLSSHDFNEDKILLIESKSIFNNISQYKNKIKKITKAIIIPKNTINNVDIISKRYFLDS